MRELLASVLCDQEGRDATDMTDGVENETTTPAPKLRGNLERFSLQEQDHDKHKNGRSKHPHC